MTVTAGNNSRIQSNTFQWVVARLPSSSPALPSNIAPVQTEASVSTLRPASAIHDNSRSLSITADAPAAGDDEHVQRRADLKRVVGDDLQPARGDQHVADSATRTTS